MTYGFADFFWLIFLGGAFGYFLHMLLGGVISLVSRGIEKRNQIAVTLKDRP